MLAVQSHFLSAKAQSVYQMTGTNSEDKPYKENLYVLRRTMPIMLPYCMLQVSKYIQLMEIRHV